MSEKVYYSNKEIEGFITAKEAREMTDKVIIDMLTQETLKNIKREVKLGHNSCTQEVHQNIDVEVVMSFLRSIGYTVKIVSYSNYQCTIKISW